MLGAARVEVRPHADHNSAAAVLRDVRIRPVKRSSTAATSAPIGLCRWALGRGGKALPDLGGVSCVGDCRVAAGTCAVDAVHDGQDRRGERAWNGLSRAGSRPATSYMTSIAVWAVITPSCPGNNSAVPYPFFGPVQARVDEVVSNH